MDVVGYGLDWLTLTNKPTQEGEPGTLMGYFTLISKVSERWRGMGYKGHQDKDVGIRYGSRSVKDGSVDEVLIMSGGLVDSMVEKMRGLLAYKVTRVDIQITVRLEKPDSEIASRQYENLIKLKEEGFDPPGRRRVSSVRSDTGSTLYVGVRKTGRKFLRLYDKSDGYDCPLGTIWRQEIQYGRDLAKPAMELYQDIKGDRAAIIDLVSAEFHDCAGLSLFPYFNRGAVVNSSEKPKKATLGAKLEWLKRCVKPTIALLIDNDLQDEAVKALGLSTMANYRKFEDGKESK